jgi:hypothetical protein
MSNIPRNGPLLSLCMFICSITFLNKTRKQEYNTQQMSSDDPNYPPKDTHEYLYTRSPSPHPTYLSSSHYTTSQIYTKKAPMPMKPITKAETTRGANSTGPTFKEEAAPVEVALPPVATGVAAFPVPVTVPLPC